MNRRFGPHPKPPPLRGGGDRGVRAAVCIKTRARRSHEQRFSNDATTVHSLLYWNDALVDRSEYRAFVCIVHLDAHSIAPF